MRARIRRALAVVALSAASIGVCALPTDESARAIDDPDVEDVMNPTSTTSTTAVTGTTRLRELWFIQDPEGLLSIDGRQVATDATITGILNLLTDPPSDGSLRSAIPPEFQVVDTSLDAATGTLRIDIAEDLATLGLSGNELLRAVAQIVVTAIDLEGWEVDQVRFFVDGEVTSVPAGELGEDESDPVDACDYQNVLPEDVPCSSIGRS